VTVDFRLPDLAEGVAEGEVVAWRVAEGDRVAEDDVIAEVETDKALVEVPSPHAGVVAELCATEGEVVPVGEVLVQFEVDGEAVTVDSAVGLFDETPGRVVIETTDPEGVRAAFDGVAAVESLGTTTDDGVLSLTVGDETVELDAEAVAELRRTIPEVLE